MIGIVIIGLVTIALSVTVLIKTERGIRDCDRMLDQIRDLREQLKKG